MTLETFYLSMAVVALFNIVAAIWTGAALRRLRRERDVCGRQAEQASEVAAENLQMAEQATDALEQANELAAREKARADSQFSLIEDTCQERDGIWEMYRTHVLGAQNAQELLFEEVERMFRFIRVKGEAHGFEPLVIGGRLKKVLTTYNCQHVDDIAAKAGVQREKKRAKDVIAANLGSKRTQEGG